MLGDDILSKIKKILFITIPLVPILIGIFFAIFYNVPRLEYNYSKEYDGYFVSIAYGDAKEYVIPKNYNDKPVLGIDTRAFYNHKRLERIVFEKEDNFKYCGRLAFSGCDNLNNINLEYTMLIGKNAFANCISLDDIKIGAKYIGGSSFFGCGSLKNVTILDDCRSIGSYAFASCHSLEYLVIPSMVNTIGDKCFDFSPLKELRVNEIFKNDSYISKLDYVIYY